MYVHRHDGVPCCWDCYASKPTHPGKLADCSGWLTCWRTAGWSLSWAPPAVRIAVAWSALGGIEHPSSRLCLRCLDYGVVAPADDAPLQPACRAHLAEDRINDMLRTGQIQGWWT